MEMQKHHISRLEALNIVICVKSLIPLECVRVVVKTDNSASAHVLMSGKTDDVMMAACSRELAMFASIHQLEIEVVHIPGKDLVLADALSRFRKGENFKQIVRDEMIRLDLKWVEPIQVSTAIDYDF